MAGQFAYCTYRKVVADSIIRASLERGFPFFLLDDQQGGHEDRKRRMLLTVDNVQTRPVLAIGILVGVQSCIAFDVNQCPDNSVLADVHIVTNVPAAPAESHSAHILTTTINPEAWLCKPFVLQSTS